MRGTTDQENDFLWKELKIGPIVLYGSKRFWMNKLSNEGKLQDTVQKETTKKEPAKKVVDISGMSPKEPRIALDTGKEPIMTENNLRHLEGMWRREQRKIEDLIDMINDAERLKRQSRDPSHRKELDKEISLYEESRKKQMDYLIYTEQTYKKALKEYQEPKKKQQAKANRI